MDRTTRTNWLINATNLVAGLVILASSLYFSYVPTGGFAGGRNPWYGVTILFGRHTWQDLHEWAGLALIVLAVVHIARHWYWIALMLRRLKLGRGSRGRPLSRGSRRNVIVNVVVAASFALAAVSGAYFLLLPEGGYQGGRNTAWDPGFVFSRTAWDVIHTWSGVVFIGAVALHFWIHWRWVKNVTGRLLACCVPRPGARPTPADSKA